MKTIQKNVRRSKRRKKRIWRILILTILFMVGIMAAYRFYTDRYWEIADEDISAEKPDITVDLLDVNPYSRPGKNSDRIQGIVVHYTANPGSTAKQNRDYFNGLQSTGNRSVSSHFVIGMEGEIVQCVPTWEIAYASNERNHDTVSIECCHPNESGKFTKETYISLVQLTAWLCEKFELGVNDVIRHYDVTGKNCPKYFVENEEEWMNFKMAVEKALMEAETE